MPRTLVIGDVHGCLDELQALLVAAGAAPGDRLVFVGDLVAKGPDTAGVVGLARAWGATCVLGNHENALLAYRASRDEADGSRFGRSHVQAAATLGAADWAYIERCPLCLELPELNALVVHAGLVPGRPLSQQKRHDLLMMRTLTPQGSGSSRFEGIPWASCWQGPAHVYFGHDARRGLQLYPHATGLDTGCVYGGRLTACILPERRLVSVEARRAYVTLKASHAHRAPD